MNPSALTALAMLKVSWDQHRKSYLDSFLPFISAVLSKLENEIADVNQVQKDLDTYFGLCLPFGTVENLLRRGCGIDLYKQRGQAGGRNFSINSPDEGAELWARRSKILRKQEILLAKFMDFASRELRENLSESEAEERLLRQVERASVPILKAWLRGEQLTRNTGRSLDTDYTTSSFILNLYKYDDSGFSDLEDVVQGNMLASALYYAPNLRKISSNFKSTQVVLDTPILLRALGYEGPAEQLAASNILELSAKLGAYLVCYERTFQELKRVMSAVANSLAPGSYKIGAGWGPTRTHFLGQKATSSDVELLITKLETDLRAIGIRVIEQPPHSNIFALNEERLGDILRQRVRYRKEPAMLHDLDVLTAVYRHRGGEVQYSIEDCKAIFITPNDQVVQACRTYFEREEVSNETWPLALPDHVFATILWLKLPQQASDLPRNQLIANSYAGLVPGFQLWNKFLSELDKLAANGNDAENDYGRLRYSLGAQQLLMRQTLGEESRFTDGLVSDIAEHIRDAGQPEPLKEDPVVPAGDLNSDVEDAADSQTRVDKRLGDLDAHAIATEMRLKDLEKRLERVAGIAANMCVIFIGGLALAAVCAALWVGLPLPIGPSLGAVSAGWSLTIKILSICGAFCLMAGVIFGFTIKDFMISGRNRLKRWWLKKWLGQALSERSAS